MAHLDAVEAARNVIEIEVAKNRQGRTERLRLFGDVSVNAIAEVAS